MKDVLWDKKIGVLAGGTSSEREISLKSGNAVLNALKARGLDVRLIDVDPASFMLDIEASRIDLAFIALHGAFGEDGTVQTMLEEKGILYTGSGPDASRDAMDKIASKKIFMDEGLLVPGYRSVEKGVGMDVSGISIPCVVKPRFEGSSIGLTIVSEMEQVAGAIEKAFRYNDKVIVEDFIPGREVTVGVLGGTPLEVIEINTEEGVYDFKAKYHSTSTEYVVPADLDEDIAAKAKEVALKAHNALGCRGVSRVDFRLTPQGKLYVLEVNTIPGMTERSLLPMAANACGVGFDDLCVKILEEAISCKF